jgi:hypothetical protein
LNEKIRDYSFFEEPQLPSGGSMSPSAPLDMERATIAPFAIFGECGTIRHDNPSEVEA